MYNNYFYKKLFIIVFLFINLTFLSSQEKKTIDVIGINKTNSVSGVKNDPAGFTETIKTEDFKGRYTNLTDILEREAGVRVRKFGGLGSYSTLSIRGSNSNQVRMYIDGIPLNNSQGGEVNLSDLGFDNLEKIEIYKSGLSGGFSNTSIGGTVNLVTNKSEFKKVTRVNTGGGSFNTYKISGFHSDFTEKTRYSFFVQKEKSDQNFIFKTDNGTPVINNYDDKDIRRKNAFFDRYNFTSKFGIDFKSTTLNFLNDFNYRKNGIPGPASNQNEKVEREYIRNTTGISSNTKSFLIDNLSLDTRMFYTGERDHLFDPLQEFSSGTPNSKANMQNYGVHILPGLSLLNYNQIFKFLIANENETFIRDKRNKLDEITDKSTKKFRNHTTLQIQDEIRLFDKKIIIIPVIQKEIFIDRFNEIRTYTDTLNSIYTDYKLPSNFKKTEFLNKRMGIIFNLFNNNDFIYSIKSNYSTENRIPLFSELFGERGSIIGNTTLKPEKSQNIDFGFVTEYKGLDHKFSTTVSIFHKKIEDMILFIPNSQFSLKPENIDSADIKGIELISKYYYKDKWKLLSNYTYQRAINTSDISYVKGKFLPLRPLHEWNGSVIYKFPKVEIGGEVTFIGATFRDRTNEYVNYQQARWIYNLFLNYELIKDTEKNKELLLGIEIKNILNYRTYDIIGYPLPGRSIYFTLSAVF